METLNYKKIFVWKSESDDILQIQFGVLDYSNDLKHIKMNRNGRDLFCETKVRMQQKLKALKTPNVKKNKKANQTEPRDETLETFEDICVHSSLSQFDEKSTNMDVFYNCSSISVGDIFYEIVRDMPFLERITIALRPIMGCPVVPSCNWKLDNAAPNISYQWFVADTLLNHCITQNNQLGTLDLQGWERVGEGEFFHPAERHVGKFLSVVASYGEVLLARSCATKDAIAHVGEPFIFEDRQRKFCSSPLAELNSLRIVSYNILADLYLNLKLQPSELFFPFCPTQYQEDSYRYPILLRELEGYNADILCLQEVDVRMYKRFLAGYLNFLGFGVKFRCSAGDVKEGQLIAYRTSKFHLVQSLPLLDDSMSKIMPHNKSQGIRISDLAKDHTDVVDFLEKKPEVKEYMMKKNIVFQVVHLQSVANSSINLLILNTHLTSDPAYEHVKLLQTILALRYLLKIRREINSENLHNRIFSLFCGDLNSLPDSGVVRLLQDGHVGVGQEFWGKNINEGIEITEDSKFTSLAGFPDYTNYTKFEGKGFAGCLDYIFSHPELDVEQVVPLPQHELVTKYRAIPSRIAPSDHLPIICDVKLYKIDD